MITFENIQQANASLITKDIKGKPYTEVHQRIKGFRILCPMGTIKTTILSNDDSSCMIRAEIYDGDLLLATGTAYEREQFSSINRTSMIENCETSAVGRALGMLGIGIDTSVASVEETERAIAEQERLKNMTDEERMADAYPPREEMIAFILEHYDDDNLAKMLSYWKATMLEDLTTTQLVTAYNRKKAKR